MTLTKKELMERNLNLAEEHLLQILNHPELLEHIPDNAHVVFLPTDDPEAFEANLQMANQMARDIRQDPSTEPVFLVLMPTKSTEPVPV